MYNIVYFKSILTDEPSPAYNLYKAAIDNKLISTPCIFTDQIHTTSNFDIPVFHSFYLKHHFYDKYILLDIDDIKYIDLISRSENYIIVYNKKFHTIDTVQNVKLAIDINDNGIDKIKEFYAKI